MPDPPIPEDQLLLFAFSEWYPAGGADDLVGIFASADEAKAAFGSLDEEVLARGYGCQEAQIARLVPGGLQVVERWESDYAADLAAGSVGHGRWVAAGEEPG